MGWQWSLPILNIKEAVSSIWWQKSPC